MAGALQDKVVIVTGAGRGIGREIALTAAAEGAKVVVNDLGGAADGSGASAAPAEEVAAEIRAKGGKAVANFDSVAEPASANAIVKAAVDAFGGLDAVVNNAGILRDAIFHKMSVADFELVIKVHLMGTFYVSHAAARIFRDMIQPRFSGDPHEAFRDSQEKAQNKPDVDIGKSRQQHQQQRGRKNRPEHQGHRTLAGHQSRHERRHRQHRQILDGGAESDHGGADALFFQRQGQQRQTETVHQRGHTEHAAYRD